MLLHGTDWYTDGRIKHIHIVFYSLLQKAHQIIYSINPAHFVLDPGSREWVLIFQQETSLLTNFT